MHRLALATRLVLCTVLAIGFTATGSGVPSGSAVAAVNQIFLPNITKTFGGADGWTTPIVVQNIGTTPTDVTITLYRFSDGALSATVKTPVLAPGQAWSFDPRSNSALPNDTQFSAVLQAASGQVAATVIEGASSSWMAYAGTATGGATVYLPNITRNLGGTAGWNTPFIVQNIGARAATLSVSFYSFATGTLATKIDNVLLQPGRSRAFTPSIIDGLSDDTQFAVVVQGPADAQLYAIVNEVSGGMAMSYEGLLGGSDVLYLPNVLKYLGGSDRWFTPFIVQNVGTAVTTASVEFYAFDTGRLVTTLPGIVLQPGRSRAVDVRFDPPSLPAGSYSVVVRGQPGSQLGAVVNEVDPAAGMAMSYLGVGRSRAQPSAFLPFLQKNVGSAGWFSPIIAQNLAAVPSDIALTLFDANGAVAMQKVFAAVKPGAAAVYDPRFDRRLKNGTYSGLVQSAGNLSAVVNIAGAISGDYAMAFTSSEAPAIAVPAVPATTRQVGAYGFTLRMGSTVDVWVENTIDAPTVARIVSQADTDASKIQADFGREFTNIPVVYMFASSASYVAGLQTLMGYTFDQAKRIADTNDAVFQPLTKLVVANWAAISKYQPQSAVRHELSHAMTSQIIGTNPSLPAWLDEGHAYLEEITMPGARWLEMNSRYGTASMASSGTLIPLADLTSPIIWASRTGAAATFQYLEAAQAVLMLRTDLGQPGIVRILELMGQGQTFETAYASVSGRPFSTFVSSFFSRAYALAPRYPAIATVDDSPIGPGLSFIAYGFPPSAPVTVEVRSSTVGSVFGDTLTAYGTVFYYLTAEWPAGTYSITVSSPTVSASGLAIKR